MKARRLGTVLTSAYLSAMLAASVAPVRSDAILASAFDPMAAQKALQYAVGGLNAAGWRFGPAAASVATAPVARASSDIPKSDPIMTDELLARLIKYTRNLHHETRKTVAVDKKICAAFELCAGTEAMPFMMAESESAPDARHLFALLPDEIFRDHDSDFMRKHSRDVYILRQHDKIIETFRTDNTRELLEVVILPPQGDAQLITDKRSSAWEKAAAQYKAELARFAKEAADLPPTTRTGTSFN